MDGNNMNNLSENCEYEYSNGEKCKQPISKDYKDLKSRRFCIYHSHNEEKLNDFSNLIKEEIRKKHSEVEIKHDLIIDSNLSPEHKKEEYEKLKSINLINFEEYYFPKNYKTDSLERDAGHVIISANITFKNAIFSDVIVFSKFVFSGNVDFCNTVFEKDADFSIAQFYCDKIIFKSIFKAQANFDKALFQDGIPDFSKTKFYDQASFHEARFYKGAIFTSAAFKGYAYFHSAQFDKKTEFSNSTFYKEANFVDVKFDGPIYFNEVEFLDRADRFNDACCIFHRTIFEETAGFNNVIFTGNANFVEAHFKYKAEFNNAQFLFNAIFFGAEFLKDGLEAKGSIFFGDANFSDCNFDREANFGEVSFLGEKVNFTRLVCADPSLRNCTFLADIIDLGPYLSTSFNYFEGINFIGRADFTRKNCEKYRFLNCLMTGCSFLKSDIVNTIFINCSWDFSDVDEVLKRQRKILENLSYSSKSLNKFQILEKKYKEYIKTAKRKKSNTLDEVLFWRGKDIEIGEIQECCMQLKNNRDKAKDYLTANNFYQSEIEMIRIKEGAKAKEKYELYLKKHGISEKSKNQFQTRVIFLSLVLLLSIVAFIIFYPETFPCVFISFSIILSFILALTIGKFLFYTLYKVLSGYGNKPLYAVILFLIILIIFSSVLVLLDGVKNIDTLDPTNKSFQKMNILEKFYYVSMWNLANPFTSQNKQFQPKGISAHFLVFIFQYLYRPLLIALIILAIKRRVKR